MTDRHKAIILEHLETLVNNLNAEPILLRLVARHIFTMAETTEVHAQRTPQKKAEELLRLLVTKEDKAFDVFVKACQDNSMEHLARLFLDAGNLYCCISDFS